MQAHGNHPGHRHGPHDGHDHAHSAGMTLHNHRDGRVRGLAAGGGRGAPQAAVVSALLMSAPARLAVAAGLAATLWLLVLWAMS